MAVNDFQIFAGGAGANVLTQAQWLQLSSLLQNGFQTGIAQSNQVNKVWRQSSIMASMIAQLICDKTGQNATDDGTIATLEANFINAIQAIGRIKLSSPLSLFVASNGSDTNNNGLSASFPFATIQNAVNLIYNNYDTQGQTVVINVANGSYAAGAAAIGSPVGNGSIKIVGNPTSPSSVIVTAATGTACFSVALGGVMQVSGFTLSSPGGSTSTGNFLAIGSCLSASSGGEMSFDRIIFGTTGFAHLNAGSNGGIQLNASAPGVPYTITGGAQYHAVSGSGGGIIVIPGGAVTLSGTPTFGGAFAWADSSGLSYWVGTTFSGAATGPKFNATNGGYIDTGSGLVGYLPGSIAGTSSTGYYN